MLVVAVRINCVSFVGVRLLPYRTRNDLSNQRKTKKAIALVEGVHFYYLTPTIDSYNILVRGQESGNTLT